MGEPIEISTTRRVDAQTAFAEGDSLEDNPYSRMIEKLFGVKFTVAWTWATTDEVNSKYNLAMASGVRMGVTRWYKKKGGRAASLMGSII